MSQTHNQLHSYDQHYRVPVVREPVDYAAMSDPMFVQTIAKFVAMLIFVPWLLNRIYYSRLCGTTAMTAPDTYHTRELVVMTAAVVAWSTGSMVAVSVRENPLSRRLYLIMTALVPLVVYNADALYGDDETPGVAVRVMLSALGGLLAAACFI